MKNETLFYSSYGLYHVPFAFLTKIFNSINHTPVNSNDKHVWLIIMTIICLCVILRNQKKPKSPALHNNLLYAQKVYIFAERETPG